MVGSAEIAVDTAVVAAVDRPAVAGIGGEEQAEEGRLRSPWCRLGRRDAFIAAALYFFELAPDAYDIW